MSEKKLREVREDRGFKLCDLFVYGAIAVLIAALFLAAFLTTDQSPANGITVSYRNQRVFAYDFDAQTYRIDDGAHIAVLSDADGILTLGFYGASKDDYNTVVIDKVARTVQVTQANCSARKDCVHMAAITDRGGVIICTPHRMKIQTTGYEPDPDDPDIGPPME